MSYKVYLFRTEVKELYSNLEFLENNSPVTPFTQSQVEQIKNRLIGYGYQVENSDSNITSFNFRGGEYGITVLLTENQVAFTSGINDKGIAEISVTASEFTDTDEFAKFNAQDGKWEEY